MRLESDSTGGERLLACSELRVLDLCKTLSELDALHTHTHAHTHTRTHTHNYSFSEITGFSFQGGLNQFNQSNYCSKHSKVIARKQ